MPEIIQVAKPIMTHDWFSDVLNNPDETLFVAEIEGTIVGLALVETLKIKENYDVQVNELYTN